ncbi:hypothetical protein EYF80_012285 [Liparis tanakae]|uniref:Uncharacterized protein n=1 Tax=Liparis tanakae TaxID=230148 RepID=A0A4Z2IIB7_9TELE|nr:hypothetical protein EYF80_012285 [Liparis tanakae]
MKLEKLNINSEIPNSRFNHQQQIAASSLSTNYCCCSWQQHSHLDSWAFLHFDSKVHGDKGCIHADGAEGGGVGVKGWEEMAGVNN